MPKKKTQEEAIKDFIRIHGSKYDYSKVDYKGANSEIILICKRCEKEFLQTPSKHTNAKQGCKECNNKDKRDTQEGVIADFKSTHGDKYDYSKVVYETSRIKVCIICPKHGEFWQTSTCHKRGKGCTQCGFKRMSEGNILSNGEALERFYLIHRDKYDYSKVEYKNNKTEVCIICPAHGDFLITPNAHISGRGCPKCNIRSSGESKILEYLTSNCVDFEKEKTFEGCVHKYKLRFDFYLPNENLCIEYDGRQHYEPVDFYGGLKSFHELQKRDQIKNDFCKNNCINLLRISYKDNRNINAILDQKLKEWIYETGVCAFRRETPEW